MADWEALGRIMSIQSGKLDLWEEIVKDLKRAQNNFLADGEIVIEAIDTWLNSKSSSLMNSDSNIERWVTARELYTEAQQLLFNGNKPDSDWPRSVKAFSKRLNNIRSVLENRYGMESRVSRGQTQYMFVNN
jgi:glutamine synthetase type III